MKTTLPPGPRLPSLGTMVKMSAAPYRFLTECRDRYGDLFTLKQPGMPPNVFVADPEAVKTLTTAGYDDLTRNAEAIRFLLGDHAVIFQQDGQHKETRRLMLPPFHGERMRAYGGDMARVTDQTVRAWRDGEQRLLHKELQDITLKVILRSIFGLADGPRLRELAHLIVDYLDSIMTPWFYGATLLLSGARVRDFLRSRGGSRDWLSWLRPIQLIADRLNGIDHILFDEIDRCRRLSDEERSRRPDILAMLVAARYEDGSTLSDEALRDHLMTLLIGGHETTATSLTWAVACALEHPGTWQRMRDEVERVFAGGFDPSRVKELHYVGAVANESMRLYPIATAVNRQLKRELQLGDYLLPAGTIVSPCIYLVQHDARVWPDPESFRPERFLDGKASVYQFFPFGAGVWKCLGAQFAEYEMRVVLSRLVASVDLALDGAPPHPAQRGFTVAPANGLPVRVRSLVRPATKSAPLVAAAPSKHALG